MDAGLALLMDGGVGSGAIRHGDPEGFFHDAGGILAGAIGEAGGLQGDLPLGGDSDDDPSHGIRPPVRR